jgi:anti-anti-sigma factor
MLRPRRHRSKGGADVDSSSSSPSPGFNVVMDRGVHVIELTKRKVLDSFEVEKLGRQLHDYLEPLDVPRVVIDLGGIEHLSSAALSMLMFARSTVDSRGGSICLAAANDNILEVFDVVSFGKVFPLHPTTQAAVVSLSG